MLPILILGWVSMMAILIPVKSGEKISFLIAIELGLVFIIATLDTNMVPAGRGLNMLKKLFPPRLEPGKLLTPLSQPPPPWAPPPLSSPPPP